MSTTLPDADPRPDAVARMVRPHSLAIVGISSRPGSSGRTLLDHQHINSYRGQIHLVGRSGGLIDGLAVRMSIDDLPLGVDLALLAVPGAGVREAVEACVRRRVHAAVIYASGFAEHGTDGRDDQAEISELAREGGVHLVGPNCIGFTNLIEPLNTIFLPDEAVVPLPEPDGRAVAVLAQSGGLMGMIHRGLRERGIPVSYRFSTGNEAGLTLGDYLAFLADDPSTGSAVIYAEDIRRPEAFLAALRAMRARGKSVTLMHTGRSAQAQRAAASHTGALASDYEVVTTLAEHAGACVTESLEELVDVAELLARNPAPSTGGVAVATTSGAYCAIALDTLDDLDLEVAPLSPTTEEVLRNRLPSYMKADNPLDLGTAIVADPELYHDGLAALLDDDGIGSVALALPFSLDHLNMEMLAQVTRAAETRSKPVAVALLSDVVPVPDALRSYAVEHGVALSNSPERALRAIAAITRYGRVLARSVAARATSGTVVPLPAGRLSEWRGKTVLADLGLAVPAGALATTADEALSVAAQIGYPVVAKAQAPTLLHKSEARAVVLGIPDAAALRATWSDLTNRLGNAPDAPLDGVLVEEMAAPGVELVVGAKRTRGWGPVVLVGLGGIWVEALGDTRLLPPDLAVPHIVDELRRLRSAGLLGRFRGRAAVDLEAVATVVSTIGRLMLEHPEIEEIDVNPLVARADSVIALDVLITTTEVAAPVGSIR